MNYKTLFKFGSWAMLATGGLHSLSLLNNPQPLNDSERLLFDLLTFLPPQLCFTVAGAGYVAAYWFFQKR